jgi:hypothetical protein
MLRVALGGVALVVGLWAGLALALRYAGRTVPRAVLLEAWPGDPRLGERLLGPPSRSTAAEVVSHDDPQSG